MAKVFHLVIADTDDAEDFLKALSGFEDRTDLTTTDDTIKVLISEIQEVFELER